MTPLKLGNLCKDPVSKIRAPSEVMGLGLQCVFSGEARFNPWHLGALQALLTRCIILSSYPVLSERFRAIGRYVISGQRKGFLSWNYLSLRFSRVRPSHSSHPVLCPPTWGKELVSRCGFTSVCCINKSFPFTQPQFPLSKKNRY